MNDIYLDRWLTPAAGRKLTIKKTKLSRTDRTASGRLVEDIIANKRTFILTYELITGANLELFEDLYSSNSTHLIEVHHEHKATESCDVIMKPFDRERLLCVAGTLWQGFTCELEEV